MESNLNSTVCDKTVFTTSTTDYHKQLQLKLTIVKSETKVCKILVHTFFVSKTREFHTTTETQTESDMQHNYHPNR